MFDRLGAFVVCRWQYVLAAWTLVTALLMWISPSWDEITQDGDFAYLPSEMTSVQAEAVLQDAFTEERSKSQIAVIIFRREGALTEEDLAFPAYDMARRIHNAFAVAAVARAQRLQDEVSQATGEVERAVRLAQAVKWWERAEASLDEAILLDSLMAYPRPVSGRGSRWGVPLLNRALLHERCGRHDEAQLDRELLTIFDPSLANATAFEPALATELMLRPLRRRRVCPPWARRHHRPRPRPRRPGAPPSSRLS